MFMRLTNPTKLRQMYAERMRWFTIEEIAEGLQMSTRTVSKALNGAPLRPHTVKRFAEPIGQRETEIASFMN
jgi:hypothetical protein